MVVVPRRCFLLKFCRKTQGHILTGITPGIKLFFLLGKEMIFFFSHGIFIFKKSLIPVVIPVKMCPWVFLQERNRKHLQGTTTLSSPESLPFSQGPLWRITTMFACVFSVSLLQKNPRTHFDGNNTWDQTLFSFGEGDDFFFLSWHFYFQKESHPSCYSRQNVSFEVLQNFSKNTFGQRLSGELMVLPRRCFLFLSCRKTQGHILTGITPGIKLFLKIKMP